MDLSDEQREKDFNLKHSPNILSFILNFRRVLSLCVVCFARRLPLVRPQLQTIALTIDVLYLTADRTPNEGAG